MVASTKGPVNAAVKRILARLAQKEWLIGDLDWETFMAVDEPYPRTGFLRRETIARYHHNGYDWDIHGSLYTPFKNVLPGHAFVLIHGGGVNELDFCTEYKSCLDTFKDDEYCTTEYFGVTE